MRVLALSFHVTNDFPQLTALPEDLPDETSAHNFDTGSFAWLCRV